MSEANDPAFPAQPTQYSGDSLSLNAHQGLTRLEYFAGLAMQGLLANPYWEPDTIEEGTALCVKWSAALICELEKSK